MGRSGHRLGSDAGWTCDDRLRDPVLDHDERLRQREDRGTHVSSETVVHGREDGSELADREEGLEEGGVVLAEPRDTVAACDAQRAQAVGDRAGSVGRGRRT